MKKRIMVAMGLMAALLVVAAGVAWAATVNCKVGEPCVGTNDPDRLNGTNQEDDMFARQDDDLLRGRSGFDILFGDHPPVQNTTTDGDDELFGNNGPDTLAGLGGSDLESIREPSRDALKKDASLREWACQNSHRSQRRCVL
jgi:hypothetical protein